MDIGPFVALCDIGLLSHNVVGSRKSISVYDKSSKLSHLPQSVLM